ncbi:MAG TPA: 23S rRNA (pseudouridine(1915)-N(3))-methyltransferase RlmH [Cellvibrionaceae bacterium]
MRVQLVAVGTKMPSWVQTAFAEYAKRLPKELAPKLLELELGSKTKPGNTDAAKKAEAETILAVIPVEHFVVMLDVGGKAWSTEELAGQLANWQMSGRDFSFVIGGPDGLDASVRARANVIWSLSNLTLPHPLVRIVWVEQMYRAHCILTNHPYHK